MNNLEALIECYLDICQYEKKLSQDTLKAYRTDLAQFRAFVGGAEVSRDLLSQYIKYLNNSFAPRSVKRKLASLRAFYRLMETREAISQNPFEKLQIQGSRSISRRRGNSHVPFRNILSGICWKPPIWSTSREPELSCVIFSCWSCCLEQESGFPSYAPSLPKPSSLGPISSGC